ncbi:isoprenyl transferase [Herpetosiphon gulosus]|uniref:Isoprenyl transferase n=1 Tax=Herpetosiphon gulosus TaxID=1973496 RepID=A0ABP9X5R9_9CHLR
MTVQQLETTVAPRHVAIIMDGNGRWAQGRGLPRLAGHHAGTGNIKRIVREAIALGIPYLTIYAFSTENWKRPSWEVRGLMRIMAEYLDRELRELHAEGVRLHLLGTLDGVDSALAKKIQNAITLTANNTALTLSVAFNYGGRADIVNAVREIVAKGINPEDISDEMIAGHLYTSGIPDPDLIVRTSGEQRLSNFLIWQAAYSEYYMTPLLWPDFGPDQFREAVSNFGNRERRYGGRIGEGEMVK